MKKFILILSLAVTAISCSSKEDKIALDRAVTLKAMVQGYKLVSYQVQNDSDSANGYVLYFIQMQVDSAGKQMQKKDTVKLYKTLDGILLVPGDTLVNQQ